jgi:peptidoglycan/LPS O-acetylase OafA/YrhL
LEYRREIDGLRAIAVLPVIFYHAGFEAFAGGFIGVDVFFVISGYLITTIILAEMNNGKFSLLTFYERRARRILPALFFVMLCCLPFAWLWLVPKDMEYFCQSLTAVSAFSSNILFWRKSGYFDTGAEFVPLLHTWSLAIEEQFYMLFPLFLMLLWKLRKRWILSSLVLIAIVSLAGAHYGSSRKAGATFFLLPTRGWELAIGAVIAFYFLYKKDQAELIRSHKIASEAFGLLGLSLICYSIFAFDKATPFPGFYALVPTIGTALIIIFSTAKTTVGRLLGTKLMVGIGLISYSTYLWHQPLFVFARHRSLTEPNVTLLLALSALSVVLAYFTWRYIESYFRNKKVVSRSQVFAFAVTGSSFFAFAGLAGYLSQGFENHFDKTFIRITTPAEGIITGCSAVQELSSGYTAIIGDKTKTPTIALLGDSHSTTITKALDEVLINKEKSLVVYAQSWGVPLLDVATNTPEKCRSNRVFMLNALNDVVNNSNIDTVIMVAEWANYTEGRRWGDTITSYYTDKYSKSNSIDENVKVFERGLKRTLELLANRGIKIIIVGSVPEYNLRVPEYLGKLYRFYNSTKIPREYLITYKDYEKRNANVFKAFGNANVYKLANYIDTFKLFCNGTFCEYMDNDNNVFYQDASHVSYSGSKVIVNEIVKVL